MPRSWSTSAARAASSPKRSANILRTTLRRAIIVEGQLRLVEQPVGARAAGLTRGIEPHAGLADPDQQGADPGGQSDRGMGDARARLQHQAGQAADGDVRAHAVHVDHDEGAVEDVDWPFSRRRSRCGP